MGHYWVAPIDLCSIPDPRCLRTRPPCRAECVAVLQQAAAAFATHRDRLLAAHDKLEQRSLSNPAAPFPPPLQRGSFRASPSLAPDPLPFIL